MISTQEDGFREYRVAIMGDIKRLSTTMTKLQEVVTALSIEVGGLKASDRIRAVIWGNVGGMVAATIITLLIGKWTGP